MIQPPSGQGTLAATLNTLGLKIPGPNHLINQSPASLVPSLGPARVPGIALQLTPAVESRILRGAQPHCDTIECSFQLPRRDSMEKDCGHWTKDGSSWHPSSLLHVHGSRCLLGSLPTSTALITMYPFFGLVVPRLTSLTSLNYIFFSSLCLFCSCINSLGYPFYFNSSRLLLPWT